MEGKISSMPPNLIVISQDSDRLVTVTASTEVSVHEVHIKWAGVLRPLEKARDTKFPVR